MTSCAATVKLKGLRVVATPGVAIAKCVGALLTTLIMMGVLLIDVFALSAAVMVVLVIVFRVAGKLPVPFVNAEFAGNTAWPSLLVNFTIPV
jgi:hypothetical protein